MPFVRLDKKAHSKTKIIPFLCSAFNISIQDAKKSIDKGRVFCNQKRVEKKGEVVEGDITVTLFKHNRARNFPLFETKDFAVFDKPSGVMIHPPRIDKEHTLLDDIRSLYGRDANFTHRIDKETSGLVIAAKNKKSEAYFKQAFQNKNIQKTYLAYVKGKIDKETVVNAPIIKFRNLSTNLFPVQKSGRSAKTYIIPLFYSKELNATLIKAIPFTGRTHQIRIHLWHINHPIIGETLYGHPVDFRARYIEKRMSKEERFQKTGASRLMLHAYSLEFTYKNRFFITSKQLFKIYQS